MHEMNLPDHWKVSTLGKVTEIIKGGTPSRSVERYFQGNIAWAIPSDITALDSALYIHDTASHISEEGLNKSAAKLLPSGTVLLTSRATIGETAISTIPMATNQGFANFICNDEILNVYLAYYLKHIKQQLNVLASGSTFKEITKGTLLNVAIPLPSLPEQRAIAHVLQTIQKAKFTRQREIALERERKAALMDILFSHGTKSEQRKQTEIGEIPESWEVVQTGEIGKIVTGNTPKTSVPEYYGGPYMFISPGDISEPQYVTKTNKYVSAEGLKVLRPLPRDSVLVVCIGSTIGKTAMTSAEQSATNQQINAIIPKAKAFSHYVYYAVTYRSRSLPALAGRAAVPIVKKSSFAKFLIPFPPISEQHTIANIFRAIDEKIAALDREVELLDELFHVMLDELMTGQRSAGPLIDVKLSSEQCLM